MTKCACGKPLHYNDPTTRKLIEDLTARSSEYVIIYCEGKAYSVQRHYIALHGVKAAELETLADKGIVERLGDDDHAAN